MAAFLFCGLTMGAVGRAAESMVQEVRRQFREIKVRAFLKVRQHPTTVVVWRFHAQCAERDDCPVAACHRHTHCRGLGAWCCGVLGLLTGGLAAGFTLAVFMSNSGGAWDNAKKMIEEGHFGRQGQRESQRLPSSATPSAIRSRTRQDRASTSSSSSCRW